MHIYIFEIIVICNIAVILLGMVIKSFLKDIKVMQGFSEQELELIKMNAKMRLRSPNLPCDIYTYGHPQYKPLFECTIDAYASVLIERTNDQALTSKRIYLIVMKKLVLKELQKDAFWQPYGFKYYADKFRRRLTK